MHLVQRLAAVVLTLGLSAGLVGCGFHLKGMNPSDSPMAYTKIQLALPANTEELEKQLVFISLRLAHKSVRPMMPMCFVYSITPRADSF